MVNDWGGTKAQLACNISLQEAAQDNIPTLADVNAAFDNTTSIAVISEHIKSLVLYAGVEISAAQLAETSLSILTGYYYLNLAELCIFFRELKNGNRGQVVWGSKLNNHALMVALKDFATDRRAVRERLASEKAKEIAKTSFTRIEAAAGAMIKGINNFKKQREEAKRSFHAFKEIFPCLPEGYDQKQLWRAWRGSPKAIAYILGREDTPPRVASDFIGKWLCEYNIKQSNKTA